MDRGVLAKGPGVTTPQPDVGGEREQRLVERLARELVERQRASANELERVREEKRRLERRVARRTRRLRRCEDQVVELQAELDGLYASETWRVGTTLLWLPRRLRALGRR